MLFAPTLADKAILPTAWGGRYFFNRIGRTQPFGSTEPCLYPTKLRKLARLRLRGLTGATDEFTLAAMVQNLRRMAKLLPQGPPLTG
jgi:hypothetical protein